MKLSKITEGIEGKLIKDGEFERVNFCTVNEGGPFLTFMEREKFMPALLNNEHVSCVVCKSEMADALAEKFEGVFVVDEPKAVFDQIHNRLSDHPYYKLPEFDTNIGENCSISPLAVIPDKNVMIGNNVTIGPFVYIGEHVTIGDNCKIHNHATIGGRSFSYARIGEMDVTGLIDCGSVVLEDGVEVMSYSHIARGILPTDCTMLEKNTIIDAHVHIGHGAHLAKRDFIAAGAVIAGNCIIGEDTWVGINATISNRISVGKRCRVSLGAVVTKDVPDDTIVSGNFAILHDKFIKETKQRAQMNASHPGVKIHENAKVDNGAVVGKGTRVWGWSHIMDGAEIGENCNVGEHSFIEGGVKIGNGVTIKNNIALYSNITIEDDAFLGPNCVFTNVLTPRSFISRKSEFSDTLIQKGATIGANATIICGNTIGKYAMVGAGSVVTKNVPDYALVTGNPAKKTGYVCECGERMREWEDGRYICKRCGKKYREKRFGGLEEV